MARGGKACCQSCKSVFFLNFFRSFHLNGEQRSVREKIKRVLNKSKAVYRLGFLGKQKNHGEFCWFFRQDLSSLKFEICFILIRSFRSVVCLFSVFPFFHFLCVPIFHLGCFLVSRNELSRSGKEKRAKETDRPTRWTERQRTNPREREIARALDSDRSPVYFNCTRDALVRGLKSDKARRHLSYSVTELYPCLDHSRSITRRIISFISLALFLALPELHGVCFLLFPSADRTENIKVTEKTFHRQL